MSPYAVAMIEEQRDRLKYEEYHDTSCACIILLVFKRFEKL